MYLRGLTIKQIATWCRVDYEKVRLHIRFRERHDPSIFDRWLILHDRPKPSQHPQVEPRRTPWEVRFAQLEEFISEHHRFPQQLSEDRAERQLHRWLARQRENFTHGRMKPEHVERLNALGTWRGNVLGDRGKHWQNVHTQLLQFIEDNGRMPKYTGSDNPHESTLNIWVQTQRLKARAGKLIRERAAILDATVPGWDQTQRSSSN